MTIRQTIEHIRLGCHDTLSAFAPYRMAHGGYWVCHRAAGWYTVDKYRFEAYHGAGSHPSIVDMEDCSDPWQIWGTRICTAVIAAVSVMAGYLLVTP